MDKITLKIYGKDGWVDGEEVSVSRVARSLTLQNMADLMDEFLNIGMKDQREGREIGRLLRNTHRTLQGSIYRFCLSVIIGLSEQEYTDARNEVAVRNGKKIAKMVEDGEIEMGYMI